MKKLLLAIGLFLGCNTINESEITKSEINEVPKQFVLMLDFRKLP